MRNLDLIKQDLRTLIDDLNIRELYLFDSLLRDYAKKEIGKDIPHRFTCDKCNELFGGCSPDKNYDSIDICVNRFKAFCILESE